MRRGRKADPTENGDFCTVGWNQIAQMMGDTIISRSFFKKKEQGLKKKKVYQSLK